MSEVIALGGLITLAAALLVLWSWSAARQRALGLTFADDDETEAAPPSMPDGFLSRWLHVAGFRSTAALSLFLAATFSLLAAGTVVAFLLHASGAVDQLVELMSAVPGGVGEVFLPIVWLSPWLAALVPAVLPTMVVRSTRRKRVAQVEQDLPVTLDLLATLAEAGLGFDSAIDRILATQPPGRVLVRELRSFQRDVMAGRPRIAALQRPGSRVDVTWFSIFISAVVQAERLGAGLAAVVRMQADDLRSRRRERALAFAMSLQAKLILPLVVCFFPAIAVVVLGPTFHQIFQMLDSLFRPVTGGGT